MKKKVFSIMFALVLAISLTLVPTTPAMANDVASSTMHFEGDLTDEGGGVYTGTIAMTVGEYYVTGGPGEGISTAGGFDVYAQEGGTTYVQGMTPDSWTIGSDHDAYSEAGPWGTWYDPDCADWNMYSLELTADHWYLRYTPTGESPMSGVMYWYGDGTGYAAETDPGTVRNDDGSNPTDPLNRDATRYANGSAQEWGWHCGWGEERIPLELPGFTVAVTSGSYVVTMTPAPGPVTNLDTGVTYGTIQLAIDAASPGHTISASAGTYPENVVIDKSLTLEAASSPVIDGGGMLGPGVHITAADVTFQGFTVTNFTCTPSSGVGGIWVEGDRAIINDNTIYNIVTTGDPINDPAGIGIDVHASNVEVTNNIVHDVGSIGIRVRHDWDTAPTVSNNVLLEKNEVYRTANTGVLVTGYAKGVTIRENEIYESLEPTEYNLFVHYGAEDVLIENNIIRDPYDSIYGHNVVLAGCDDVTISGNTITGATSGKNIYILSDYGPWVDAELLSTNVNIINNDIQNGQWGVRITKTIATGDVSQMAATTTINFNNISGNTEYGVENTIATDVDALYNWWGDCSGPGPVGPGSGDSVSANVLFNPWLGQQLCALKVAIAAVSDEDFKSQEDATDQRDSLLEKVDAVCDQYGDGAYRGAKNKLQRDLMKRIDKWIEDPPATDLIAKVNAEIAILENFLQ